MQRTTNPWLVLVVLCLGFFMILLDTTIVNIAIPSIVDALNSSLDQILWVINAYILVYAVLLITAGRLGDLFGQRNVFVFGLSLFTIASAVCSLSGNTDQLIVARVVQGVGGALLTPQTLAILTSIFPPEKRGAAFGIWGAVGGVAAVVGPTLGGFIVTNWSWREIFVVNVPVGIVAFVATFLVIPDLRPGQRHGLDIPGVVLASVGLLGIVFGLIEGERYNWGTIWGPVTVIEVIVIGVLCLIAFALWERSQAEPLIPRELFAERNFVVMNWVSAAMAFGMLGLFLPITIFLQSVLGMTALQAGLTTAPMSFVSLIVAPFSGRLTDRLGGKYILLGGLVLFGAGMGWLAWAADTDSTWLTFLGPLVVAGFGLGCIFAPLASIAMRDISPRVAGAASGVLNTTRQVGGVIGSAAVGAVLQNRLAVTLPERAEAVASQIPAEFRQRFIDGFANAAQSGLDVGRVQSAGFQLPPGVPPAVGQQLQQIVHDVFSQAFVAAMKPTLVVPVILVLIAAVSCLAVSRQQPPTPPLSAGEEAAAAAGASARPVNH